MKTRFLQRRNALLTPAQVTLGAAVCAVAVLLLLLRLIFPGALVAIASPFWRVGTFLSDETHTIAQSFGNAAAVGKELDASQAQNEALVTANDQLEAKVKDLTALVGTRPNARAGILAAVIARPPFAAYDTLVIDEGSDAGIVPGSVVSGNDETPVGTIASVTGGSSRVLLYSAPGVQTPGWIGDNRIPVTLQGEGAGTFSLSIPKTASTTVGSLVYIAGNGISPVARVARMDSDSSSAFTDVQLAPLINPFSILWVSVAP